MSPSSNIPNELDDPVAIIGLAFRLPGATSEAEFWDLLSSARSARSKVPADRFNVDSFYHPDPNRADSGNVRHGHFLSEDIARFDAPFFSIQPNEAVSMDPQQRLVLETSYHALENAGLKIEGVSGSDTAVYIGTSSRDYESLLTRDSDEPSKYIGTGIGTSLIANRVSYFLNLKGPSLAIDTGCSGSLVALHHACKAIQSGESDTALVGGVSLIISPDVSLVHLSNMGFFSPDGYCFSFDERANGYSKGEGVAMVVMKRLSAALRDGNTIRAIVRGSSCNQDGHTPGLTVPSIDAQVNNIRKAYQRANLSLDDTAFFEAHGTGTQVGDTIEAEAIYRVFQRPKDTPIHVGALKSNIGHLEAASGVAGLAKCVLSLEHGIIPPNINFRKANPKIDPEGWGLKFPTELMQWPREGPRRISLNSFGYGGTNAHVIIDDAASYLSARGIRGQHNTTGSQQSYLSHNDGHEDKANGHADFSNGNGISMTVTGSHELNLELSGEARLLVFSAADESSLESLTSSYQECLRRFKASGIEDLDAYLDSLSYTLANGRSKLPWKTFTFASTTDDMVKAIVEKLQPPVRSSRPARLLMVFTGQGAQYARMGYELLPYPVFRNSLTRADEALKYQGCGWSLMIELAKGRTDTLIHDPWYAQTICTALQLALVDLLASWEVFPAAVVGHSSGEIAAAYAAGALTFEQAMQVAYSRGVVCSKLASNPSIGGAMSFIAMSEEKIAPIIDGINRGITQLEVGCVNSNNAVTVTGQADAVREITALMDGKGVFSRILPVSVAYHSTYMGTVAMDYRKLLKDLSSSSEDLEPKRTTQMFSSVTGGEIAPFDLQSPDYWVRNLVSQVQFLDAVSDMVQSAAESHPTYSHQVLEIGPHGAMQFLVKDIITHLKQDKNFESDSLLTRGENAETTTLTAIGRLWCKGVPIDVSKVRRDPAKSQQHRYLLDLPKYPFNHSTKYWHEGRISRNYRFKKYPRHDFVGNQVADWNRLEPRWRNIVRLSEHPWLRDYVIEGRTIYPPGALLVMAIEAVRQLQDYNDAKLGSLELRDVVFEKELIIPDTEEVETQITLRPIQESHEFSIYAFENDETTSICRGVVRTLNNNNLVKAKGELDRLRDRKNNCTDRVDAFQYYDSLASMGYSFGPELQKFPYVEYRDANIAIGRFEQQEGRRKTGISDNYLLHPADLETMLQVSFAAVSYGGSSRTPVLRTKKLTGLWIGNRISVPESRSIQCLGEETSRGTFDADSSILAVDTEGHPLLRIDQLHQAADISLDAIDFEASVKHLAYQLAWKPDPSLLSGAQIKELMQASVAPEEAPSDEDEDFQEVIAYHYVGEALKNIPDDEVPRMPPHLQKYMAWAKHIFRKDRYERLLNLFPKFADWRQVYEDEQAARSSAIEMHVETGRQLLPILRGHSNALDLLFKSGLAERYYANELFAVNYQMLASYLDLLAHKNPSLKILEVGAGTGGATKPIMAMLSSDNPDVGISRFEEYMYTDISPVFFEKAKELFKNHLSRMSFQVLDIEKDVLSQSFQADHYDVVICSGVLHISAAMQPILRNIRKLLKPGGKLVQFEPSNPDTCRAGFTFGLLKDWWVAEEEHRKFSPLIGEERWDEDLKAAGFSGTDVAIPSNEVKERQTHSIFISTRIDHDDDESVDKVHGHLHIVIDPESSLQSAVAQQVGQTIGQRYRTYVTTTLADLEHSQIPLEATFVFLMELEHSFLGMIREKEWDTLKTIMDKASRVVWVTHGGGQRPSNPDMSIVTGFGRSMMTEKLNLDFIELALEAESGASGTAERIRQILIQRATGDAEFLDPEYSEESGRLCVGRLVAANTADEQLQNMLVQRKPVDKLLSNNANPSRSLRVAIAKPGDIDSFYFAEDLDVSQPLAANELKIRVEASSVNANDVEIATGKKSGRAFGVVCAGTITQLGSAVSNLQVGDQVVACPFEAALTTSVTVVASAVAKMPDSADFIQAVNLTNAHLTAYYAVKCVARLGEGDSVLIVADGSIVNRAVTATALATGADVYVTSTEGGGITELIGDTGSSRETPRVESQSTSQEDCPTPEGFDAIITTWATDVQFCKLLAPSGCFIDIGVSSPHAKEDSRYIALDLANMVTDRKMKKSLGVIMSSLNWTFKDIESREVSSVFKVWQLSEAFGHVQESSKGSVAIVDFASNATVKIAPPRIPLGTLDENATYVVGGGSGGIGRAIILWLIGKGARHFLILSRSGATSSAMQSLLTDFVPSDVNIQAPPCDLSDQNAVIRVLQETQKTMPPIKGVIQATMILREGILENLTCDDWHAALAPKVQGTWNLHTHLPRTLDFFVCLSSVAGITGCRSQASYNAACTYQDSLVRYRHTLGERGMSLDLGVVVGVGWAAETDKMQMLKREGYLGIPKQEFLAMLEYCCSADAQQASTLQGTQLVTGLSYMLKYKPTDESKVYWARNANCAVLRQLNTGLPTSSTDSQTVSSGDLLAAADSEDAATEIALDALTGKLSRLFGIPEGDIDASMPIFAIGIDSLVAIELRHWLMKELRADVLVAEINRDQALRELARCAAGRSGFRAR